MLRPVDEGDAAGRPRVHVSRAMTCDARTAAAVARATVRARLRQPSLLGPLAIVAVGASAPLVVSGYPLAGVIEGVLGVVVTVVLCRSLWHRKALAAAQRMYPPGQVVTVVLDDDALALRTGLGEHRTTYRAFRSCRVVGQVVLLPLRAAPARVVLPLALLEPADVEWLRSAVAQPARPGKAQPADDTGGEQRAGRQDVVMSAEMVRRMERALLRRQVSGKAWAVAGCLGLAVLLYAGSTGHWAAGAVAGAAGALGAMAALVARQRRWLHRGAPVGRVLSVRLDDEGVHVDSGESTAFARYATFRRVEVRDGVVLLWTRAGVGQVFPAEVFGGADGVERLRVAVAAATATAAARS